MVTTCTVMHALTYTVIAFTVTVCPVMHMVTARTVVHTVTICTVTVGMVTPWLLCAVHECGRAHGHRLRTANVHTDQYLKRFFGCEREITRGLNLRGRVSAEVTGGAVTARITVQESGPSGFQTEARGRPKVPRGR
ncbi:hypothetical protein AAFF_G00202410 [Aldrovandia affinis]|uniref:Uncharacterized protein n=1 Tax=Aldrovandia affinis TaxID=143900 RepID=A0AAD7SX33_9TELE|nr:hypothetical protein AAFF_G00202410 [Aldrovandia affinis]